MAQHNDYLIRVKANQKKLYQGIEAIFKEQAPVNRFLEYERTRERQTQRRVWVYDQIEGLDVTWAGLRQVVVVERSGWRGGVPYQDRAYYITSLSWRAEALSKGIRGHWGIENRLHWIKDVVFKEDTTRLGGSQVPEKRSVLLNFVITIFRKNKMDSITRAIRKVAHDIEAICKLIE